METVHEIILKPDLSRFCVLAETNPITHAIEEPVLHKEVVDAHAMLARRFSRDEHRDMVQVTDSSGLETPAKR